MVSVVELFNQMQFRRVFTEFGKTNCDSLQYKNKSNIKRT